MTAVSEFATGLKRIAAIAGLVLSVAPAGRAQTTAPEERERVFDAFYRVLGQDETGSGLGLSIVQNIAARLNAKISLTYANEPAQNGLTVTVTFPPQTAQPPETMRH